MYDLRFSQTDPSAVFDMAPKPPPADIYQAESYRAEDSVGYLMKRIVLSIVSRADLELAQHELTNAQWAPLMRLQKFGRSNVAELARWSNVDGGSMTRLLDRLEKKKLCRRIRSVDDRRVVHVELTPEGAAAIAVVPGVLARVMNDHLAGFSRAEWLALKGYLERMVDNGSALHPGE